MRWIRPTAVLSSTFALACAPVENEDTTLTTFATSVSTGTDGASATASATVTATATAASSDSGSTSSPDESSDDTTPSTTDDPSAADSSTADPPDQLPPTNAAELRPWLESQAYLGWAAESAIHDSAGPHGNGVRTFFNDSLLQSFVSGNPTHPVDAAVVKELYDAGVVEGWAVMVKVAEGSGGASWYWYEVVGSSTYADGTDVGLCVSCHETGVDQILTPFPLQ